METKSPTLLKAINNFDNKVFKSEGHLTACNACGKMMYHNLSGSDEDLCRVEFSLNSGHTRSMYLCRPCLDIIHKETQ